MGQVKSRKNIIKYSILIILFFAGLIWSGINPRNQWHWLGEVAPAIVGVALLFWVYKRVKFTYFTYVVMLLAAWCLFLGGHYTFSRVPFFDFIREITGAQRNNFDKFGHFMQGVVPTLVAQEIFFQKRIVTTKWMAFFSFCICMATTSIYEIIEFLTCLIAQKPLESFMGTQGYKWDSQTDMLWAMIGSLLVLFPFKKIHRKIVCREFPEWDSVL